MIGADLERLLPPHEEPYLSILKMFEQLHLTRPALLPLPRLTVEPEELCLLNPEDQLFALLMSLRLNLFREVDNWLELGIRLMRFRVLVFLMVALSAYGPTRQRNDVRREGKTKMREATG